MKPIEGGCLCGGIRYSIDSPPLGSGQCFCRDCQYTCGGGPANAFVIPRDALTIEGEPRVYESRTHLGGRARRYFCPTCGTPLFGAKSSNPGMIAVMAGSLDVVDDFRPEAISWVEQAPEWAVVDGDLPAYSMDISEEPPDYH